MADPFINGLAMFGIDLPVATQERLEQFLDELLRWNQKVNLTAIRARDEALEKHLLDSLLLLNYLPSAGRMLDMGSGGGFPGIPLAIVRPGLEVVSIDSVGKKITFQKHIRRLLSLTNLHPRHSRLEDMAGNEFFEMVTARALSSLDELIGWAAPLQIEGGRLLVMKGPEGAEELNDYLSSKDGKLYGLLEQHKYCLPCSGSERELIILTRSSY